MFSKGYVALVKDDAGKLLIITKLILFLTLAKD